jgi:hypothetical protein
MSTICSLSGVLAFAFRLGDASLCSPAPSPVYRANRLPPLWRK